METTQNFPYLTLVGRFTKAEREALKAAFAEDRELLILLRNKLLQENLTPEESEYLYKRIPEGSEIFNYIKKEIHQKTNKNDSFGNYSDFVYKLNSFNFHADVAIDKLYAMNKVDKYFEQEFAYFFTETDKKEIVIKDLVSGIGEKDDNDMLRDVITRDYIITRLDNWYNDIIAIISAKEETAEETAARTSKNSTK